jgi:5-methylcytosine-specific restriction protein A
MIGSTLRRVLGEYLTARESPFAGNPLAQFIARDAPAAVRDSAILDPEFSVVGSPGKGNWVTGPWIAVLDPIVTDSAQEGYYPVYLFAPSMDRVYFSLNQSVTALRNELGTVAARKLLESRASILSSRLRGIVPGQFTQDPIDLSPREAGSLLELYERGHVLGRMYSADRLPPEEVLAQDLKAMVGLYRRATALGGTTDFSEVGEADGEGADGSSEERLLEGRRRTLHARLERNCGFDFGTAYGELGSGFIEAHHLTPLRSLPLDGGVSLSPRTDFTVVCANCHRMIHRRDAPKDFNEFVKLFGRKSRG